MYILLAIIVIIVIAVFLLGRSAPIGTLATGERLEKMSSNPNFKNGVYENLEVTPAIKEGVSSFEMLRSFFFGKDKRNVPSKPLPSIKTDFKNLDINENLLVWFGHSSYLLQLDGKRILVDPVFSKYASPVPFGIKAFQMTYNYTAADMPDIDILVVTHDHFDHLDYSTFEEIKGRTKQIVTSLGVGAHFEKWGYPSDKIHELYWGESFQVDSLKFTAAPARHFAGRWFKRNTSLWSAFVLQSQTYKLLLGGDSGYGKHFKTIGEEHGPFDLVLLENGQYNEYWKYIHMMPEEVIQAAEDLRAKDLIPVHSGKFPLANHAWDEPLIRVTNEAKRKNRPIWTPQIGQVVYLGKANQFSEWWNNID
ncbi:MBL fold metallo-hydrolase [Sphingobacterium sp. CZ-2]|nr:MBL fold metallo-hydrolase [Sphingobacterium sp. CZ-2]